MTARPRRAVPILGNAKRISSSGPRKSVSICDCRAFIARASNGPLMPFPGVVDQHAHLSGFLLSLLKTHWMLAVSFSLSGWGESAPSPEVDASRGPYPDPLTLFDVSKRAVARPMPSLHPADHSTSRSSW